MQGSFIFGTVGAPISTGKKPGGSVGAIIRLHELNLGALELGWVKSVRVTRDTCEKIWQACQEKGIVLSVHAPYYINLNASDQEWPKSRNRLMDAAYYGSLAGATDIIFHPGSYLGQPVEEVVERSIERLRDCVTELRASGNKVTLRPETMGKRAMLGSLEDILKMSQAIPGIEPCLDFAHLHARAGDGSMNTEGEWKKVLDRYKKILGYESLQHLHIHMSGIEYNQKGERNHLPIVESDFNIPGLFSALIDYQCAGRILCESPIMEDDALFMQKQYSHILSK